MATILKRAVMAAHNHGFLPFRAVSPLIRLLGLEAS
ncbi:hypothetical protein B0G73_105191 [Paraburkholderia sp. BL25I1N1]|nr:hypothetical protein B0G73_105191 [Paraburkholderia sp. BL25I1N1]